MLPAPPALTAPNSKWVTAVFRINSLFLEKTPKVLEFTLLRHALSEFLKKSILALEINFFSFFFTKDKVVSTLWFFSNFNQFTAHEFRPKSEDKKTTCFL